MKRRCFFATAPCAVVGLLLSFSPPAQGQTTPLRVLASNGVRALLEELRPESEKVTGHAVTTQFGTSVSLKELVAKGEVFDVAIMTSEAVDDLIKDGRLVPATRSTIGRVGIGVGIRTGMPKPDIKTSEAMKQTLLNARAISYAGDGASRPYIVRMIDNLGIADQMKPKTILEQGSVRAAERVTKGDADLLITLISEILPVAGMELVGPLPQQFQSYVSFAAAVGTRATNTEAAKILIAYLSSPAVEPTLKAKGITRH